STVAGLGAQINRDEFWRASRCLKAHDVLIDGTERNDTPEESTTMSSRAYRRTSTAGRGAHYRRGSWRRGARVLTAWRGGRETIGVLRKSYPSSRTAGYP